LDFLVTQDFFYIRTQNNDYFIVWNIYNKKTWQTLELPI
jgi:hypothetical protein